MRCAIRNFWNLWNLSWSVVLLETFRWDLKWDVLLESFETCQTYHGGLSISNFQMRLEKRCDVPNIWNLKLFKLFKSIKGIAYLKLLDEAWNEVCYLKLLKLFKPIMECCLFETFRWDLKWDVLLETFETCQIYHGVLLIGNFQMRLEMRCAIRNLSNLSWRVAYLKLLDETWNEMCYLKIFKPIMEGCLFETFRWDLKWDVAINTYRCLKWDFWNLSNLSWSVAYLKLSDDTWNEMWLFETFETFHTYHGGLLVWIFQMRLEMRCAIRNFWNFSNLCMECCLFETFRWDLKSDVAIWNFWNLSNLSRRVAYWKLSDETWNEMCYLKLLKLFNPSQELLIWNFQMAFEMRYAYLKHLKCLKLETVKTCNGSCLFQTFRSDLKKDVMFQTFETWNFSNFSNPSKGLLIWNF